MTQLEMFETNKACECGGVLIKAVCSCGLKAWYCLGCEACWDYVCEEDEDNND